MALKEFASKFKSKCIKCSNVIQVGDAILWDKETRKSQHKACPTIPDVQMTFEAEQLNARITFLKARVAEAEMVLGDYILENLGERPVQCGCGGIGIRSMEINYSNTMDYSDYRTYYYTCGVAAESHWVGDINGAPSLRIAGTENTPAPTAPNPTCVLNNLDFNQYITDERCIRENHELGRYISMLKTEIERCEALLIPWHGDVVEGTYRRKPVKGTVKWIGADSFSYERKYGIVVEGEPKLVYIKAAKAKFVKGTRIYQVKP